MSVLFNVSQRIHTPNAYNKKRVMDVDGDDDDGKMVAAVSTPVTVAKPKAHLFSPTTIGSRTVVHGSTTAGTAFR